jgi:hypothetical protein
MDYTSDNNFHQRPLDENFRVPSNFKPFQPANLDTDFVLQQLVGNIRAWETRREAQNQLYNKYWWTSFLTFFVGGAFAGLSFLAHIAIGVVGLIGVVIATILIGRKATAAWEAFATIARNQIFTPLIESTLPNTKYTHNTHIPETEFDASGLYRDVNEFSGEDHIQSTIDNVIFAVSQVKAVKRSTRTNSKGKTQTRRTTIFNGLFFVIHLAKITPAQILVQPDVAERAFGGAVGKFFQKISTAFTGKSLVKFDEDPEFEKLFAVYSTETNEARRVLSEPFRTFLIQLATSQKNTAAISINSDRIYLGFNNGIDFLPINIKQPLTETLIRAYLEEWLTVLRTAQQIIHYLSNT